MVQQTVKKSGRRVSSWGLPFELVNYIWLAAGLVVIIAGYFFLSQGPADSFQSRTLGPVLLVIGYCVFVPIGLMAKKTVKEK